MDKQIAAEMIPLFQAIVDGKEIEERYLEGEWREFSEPWMFADGDYSYRVKPEPRVAREWNIRIRGDGSVVYSLSDKDMESGKWNTKNIIRVREVLDE